MLLVFEQFRHALDSRFTEKDTRATVVIEEGNDFGCDCRIASLFGNPLRRIHGRRQLERSLEEVSHLPPLVAGSLDRPNVLRISQGAAPVKTTARRSRAN
jgi:hypothetical protein